VINDPGIDAAALLRAALIDCSSASEKAPGHRTHGDHGFDVK
jgi:hypothetical protein